METLRLQYSMVEDFQWYRKWGWLKSATILQAALVPPPPRLRYPPLLLKTPVLWFSFFAQNPKGYRDKRYLKNIFGDNLASKYCQKKIKFLKSNLLPPIFPAIFGLGIVAMEYNIDNSFLKNKHQSYLICLRT